CGWYSRAMIISRYVGPSWNSPGAREVRKRRHPHLNPSRTSDGHGVVGGRSAASPRTDRYWRDGTPDADEPPISQATPPRSAYRSTGARRCRRPRNEEEILRQMHRRHGAVSEASTTGAAACVAPEKALDIGRVS